VELELMTEPGTPITAAHEWLAALKDLGLASVRVQSMATGAKPEIRQRGSDAAPLFQVNGVLTGRNTLRLPGAEFRLNDKEGLAKWFAKLTENGEEGLHDKPGAFGLTAKELLSVSDALSGPVALKTKGEKPYDVLKQIAGGLKLGFATDDAVRRALATEELVADELEGLSSGTALATVLRPLGLVLVPQKQPGGEIRLRIADVRQVPASWPIGWPPQKSPRETLPELFNFVPNVVIDASLDEALEMIGERIKTPILLDHNGLARQRIILSQLRPVLPPGRTYYQKIIEKILYQAKLKMDLRVDEAGKGFLWVSPLKQ
jgi:hypothetical protein